jgi:molecular chaperone DnaK (HSP70)
MARAVGIDLGTTNSVVSILEAGEPVVIPNSDDPVGRRVLEERRDLGR